jgi:hypothetical protein
MIFCIERGFRFGWEVVVSSIGLKMLPKNQLDLDRAPLAAEGTTH